MSLPRPNQIQVPLYARWHAIRVIDVIDGDTLRASIECGCDIVVERQVLRLRGINAPELNAGSGADGRRSAAALNELVGRGHPVIRIHGSRRDRYGRWLVDLYVLQRSGETIWANRWLVDSGYAEETATAAR